MEGFENTTEGLNAKLSTLERRLQLQMDVVTQYERALEQATSKLTECYNRQTDYAQRLDDARQRQSALGDAVSQATTLYERYKNDLGETDSATIMAKANMEAVQEKYRVATEEVNTLAGQQDALRRATQNAADAVSTNRPSSTERRPPCGKPRQLFAAAMTHCGFPRPTGRQPEKKCVLPIRQSPLLENRCSWHRAASVWQRLASRMLTTMPVLFLQSWSCCGRNSICRVRRFRSMKPSHGGCRSAGYSDRRAGRLHPRYDRPRQQYRYRGTGCRFHAGQVRQYHGYGSAVVREPRIHVGRSGQQLRHNRIGDYGNVPASGRCRKAGRPFGSTDSGLCNGALLRRYEIDETTELMRNLIRQNTFQHYNEEEFNAKYNPLKERYEKALAKHEKLKKEMELRENRAGKIAAFIDHLGKAPASLEEWDSQVWSLLLEKGTVNRDGSITFEFRNGKEIKVEAK